MLHFNRVVSLIIPFCLVAVLALILTPMASAQGLRILAISENSDKFFELDPLSGDTGPQVTITLAGFTVFGCSGVAVQPGTGIVFALLQTNLDSAVPRRLVTLDPGTGVATDIGPADDGSGLTFADITFTAGGTLFGVTGDDANFPGPSPETLFTLNTATAVPTLVTALGNGSDGEAIAFNPGDGLIYHLSGVDPDKVLETIDPAAPLNPPVNVPLSVEAFFGSEKPFNLAFWGNGLFLATEAGGLWVVSTTGQVLSTGHFFGLSEVAIIGTPPDCTAAGQICGSTHTGGNADPDLSVFYSIDQATGAAAMVGPIGFLNVSGIDFNAAGTLFGTGLRTDGSKTPVLITINPATGAGTEIGPTGLPGGATDISFRPSDGTLFGLAVDPGPVTVSLATWDTTTAAGTVIAPITGTTTLGGNAFAFDASDTAFYLNQNELDTLNTTTAVATVVAPATYSFPLDNNPLVTAMDFDPSSGALFGAAFDFDGDAQLVTIDTATGIVTNVGPTYRFLQAIAIRLGVATTGANLAVTKTDSPDPIILGSGDTTYTVTVTNNGPDPATNVSLTDDFTFGGGAAANFVSATPSQGTCTPAFPAVPCDLGTINSGANATVSIVVTPTAAGTVTNTASATATETDPNPANNTNIAQNTTVVAVTADLAVTKTDSPDPALVSTNITYAVTVTNNGPDGATGIVLTDTLDAAVTYVSDDAGCNIAALPVITCPLADLASGASTTVTIVVTAPATSATVTNNASVTAAEADPNPADNSTSASTTVNTVQADVSITKGDSPDPQGVGGNITYTVTVANAGPDPATNVQLTDTLSGAASTFVSVTSAGNTCNSAGFPTITCDMGTINAGASETVTIVVTATTAGTVTNTASSTATEPDPNTANNTNIAQSTTVQAAGFTLTVTPATITILPGHVATFTVTITPTPFVATVDLSATGTPPLGSLSFGSTSLNVGNAVTSTNMQVSSTGFFAAARPRDPPAPLFAYWLPLGGFGTIGLVLVGLERKQLRGNKRAWLVALLSLIILVSLIAGCAFGRDRQDEGTPFGTYPITVTATGGGVTRTATVNVVVGGPN